MDHSLIQHVDRPDFPHARAAAQSGRAVEVLSPQERSHPYARRPSLPMLDSGPRIHLPSLGNEEPPRPDAVRKTSGPQSKPINIPGISSLEMRDGPWHRSADRERYWEDRSRVSDRPSEDRVPMSRTASTGSAHPQSFRLPPFHSLGNSESHNGESLGFGPTSASMLPLPRPRTNPPSPRFAYARPSSPRLSASHSLRPSYSSHSRPNDRHEKRDGFPPLRSIHTYESPSPYPPTSAGYYSQAADGRGPIYHGHHQHDPYVNRGPQHPSYIDPSRRRQEEERPTGPGQSRRLAHLMSEQKRRESINTGFVGLRQVVPSAAATDSKAVILRKAAAHIRHLETILSNRQTGGRPAPAEGKDHRYRGAEDEAEVRLQRDTAERQSDEYCERTTGTAYSESTESSTSENVKMEREGTEDNEWRPATRN